MYLWYCKYCKLPHYHAELCVYHELSECLKNPKFKYQIQNREQPIQGNTKPK
jgi:hypothetical protein